MTLEHDIRSREWLVIVAVPAVVTALAILTKSLWGDEILSISYSSVPLDRVISSVAADYHPPAYFLLLKGWVSLVGSSELFLRVFQGLQGALLLFVSLRLFRRLAPSPGNQPWILFALSSELWLFMPMLRYYLLAACLVVLSSSAFLWYVRSPEWKSRLSLLATYSALLYTDYPSSVIILVHLLYVIVKERKLLAGWLLIGFAAFITFLPWVTIVPRQLQALGEAPRIADFNNSPLAIPLKCLYSAYAFLFGEMTYPFEAAGMFGLAVLLFVLLLVLKRGYLPRGSAGFYSSSVVLLGVLFTSFITTYFASRTSFIYTPSRTLFALPFVFILCGQILSATPERWIRGMMLGALLLVNLVGDVHWAMNRHFLMPVYASPWKEVLRDLKDSGGVVISDESISYEFYRKSEGEGSYPVMLRPESVPDLSRAVDSMSAENRPVRVYLILTGRESTEPEVRAEIVGYLASRGKLEGTRKYVPIDEEYRRIKSLILHRPGYDAKVTVYQYLM